MRTCKLQSLLFTLIATLVVVSPTGLLAQTASPDTAKLSIYSDSTLIAIDTAVSLPHKVWLDSELIEIPELRRFGSNVHFNYPASIMVETDLRPVPFDTLLLQGMNPISRENLPFFDQSPIPAPTPLPRPYEAFLQAGGGTVYQPLLTAWGAYTFSRRSSILGEIEFKSLNPSASAVLNYTHLRGQFDGQLGEDPGRSVYHSQDFTASLDYSGKSVKYFGPAAISYTHQVSQFIGQAELTGDASDKFHYEASAADHEWKDDLVNAITESSQDIRFHTHFDPYISHFRFIVDGGYSRASASLDTSNVGSVAMPSQIVINSRSLTALIGRRKGEALEWYGGLTYIGGLGPTGETYTGILPVARIRVPFNPRWEFGASFEPKVQLASLRVLTSINPFYSALQLPASSWSGVVHHAYDARSVVMDQINLSGFMNYMLSPDDELRMEARFITRSREPIFDSPTGADSSSVFSVTPKDTRRLQFSFAGNFLLFAKDILTGSVDFSSATITGEDRAIPYEPTMKLAAAYHFNSLSDIIHPMVEFQSIARKDRTLSFLNLEADAELVKHFTLVVRGDNVLGSASDFWTGYAENPRSIWASIKYSF